MNRELDIYNVLQYLKSCKSVVKKAKSQNNIF